MAATSSSSSSSAPTVKKRSLQIPRNGIKTSQFKDEKEEKKVALAQGPSKLKKVPSRRVMATKKQKRDGHAVEATCAIMQIREGEDVKGLQKMLEELDREECLRLIIEKTRIIK